MELNPFLDFESVLVLRQEGQANFVRHPLEGMYVDALIGYQTAHALFSQVDLNFVFDLFNDIFLEEVSVLFLEFVKFSLVFKREMLQVQLVNFMLSAVFGTFGSNRADKSLPVFVRVRFRDRLYKHFSDCLNCAPSLVPCLLKCHVTFKKFLVVHVCFWTNNNQVVEELLYQ